LEVITVNVTAVLPAGIVTVFETAAIEELLDKEITIPPTGAATVIVTVPVDDLPPTTDAGLKVTDLTAGGLTVKVADAETPFNVPVTLTLVALETAMVFVVNVAVLFPAATVTDAGTVPTLELLDSFTIRPPVGASPLSITVPVDDVLPVTAGGLKLIDDRAASVMVRFPV
jgi:hypothetical protein